MSQYIIKNTCGQYFSEDGFWVQTRELAAEHEKDVLGLLECGSEICVEYYFENGDDIGWGYEDGEIIARAYEVRS